MNENFPIRNGWLIPFEDNDYIYRMFQQSQDDNEISYLNDHNDGC